MMCCSATAQSADTVVVVACFCGDVAQLGAFSHAPKLVLSFRQGPAHAHDIWFTAQPTWFFSKSALWHP